jgi:Asp-tRNA(Asn)/Glu-tRNA(Gln) amidotransferase B subunit
VTKGARAEKALAEAAAGSHWQFLRQGYFFVDPVDARPGAPVFNRTMTLKDTWASKAKPEKPEPRARAARPEQPKESSGASGSRSQARAELRAANPALAERFARYQAALGLSEDEADVLTGDAEVAGYFDAAMAEHANARSVARWLSNELLGLAGDRPFDELPVSGAAFGKFVALVDAGRVTPAAGKALLASLVEKGGQPEQRARELGLEKIEDRGVVEAAIEKVLAAHAAEVTRYRAGEKKLFGVLVGAAMKETQGKADAGVVREVLQKKL